RSISSTTSLPAALSGTVPVKWNQAQSNVALLQSCPGRNASFFPCHRSANGTGSGVTHAVACSSATASYTAALIAASISASERAVATGLSGIPNLFPAPPACQPAPPRLSRHKVNEIQSGRGYPLRVVDSSGFRRLAKSVSATGARAKALPLRWTNERLLTAGGLALLTILSVGLRLVPIVIDPSINWWDEVFQSTEQAHRLVYGYGLVPWEFQLGMRSWLLPGIAAGIMEFAR